MLIRLACIAALLTAPLCAFGWADTGHILVGEIARRTMKSAVLTQVDDTTKTFVEYFPEEITSLPYSCTFMDYIKRDTIMFDNYHFIDFPHTLRDDDAPEGVPQPESINLLAGLANIYKTMSSKADNTGIWGKGFSTLMLLHLIGDMHQPLHAVSLFSKEHNFLPPLGDMGGNKYAVEYTSETGMKYVQSHLLFDCVAGLWCSYMPHPLTDDYAALIAQETDELMKDFPASSYTAEQLEPNFTNATTFDTSVKSWAWESFELAKEAYADMPLPGAGALSAEFITKWRKVLRERIALAGYRLGNTLNKLDYSQHHEIPAHDGDDKAGGVSQGWRAAAVVFALLSVALCVVAVVSYRKAKQAQEQQAVLSQPYTAV